MFNSKFIESFSTLIVSHVWLTFFHLKLVSKTIYSRSFSPFRCFFCAIWICHIYFSTYDLRNYLRHLKHFLASKGNFYHRNSDLLLYKTNVCTLAFAFEHLTSVFSISFKVTVKSDRWFIPSSLRSAFWKYACSFYMTFWDLTIKICSHFMC